MDHALVQCKAVVHGRVVLGKLYRVRVSCYDFLALRFESWVSPPVSSARARLAASLLQQLPARNTQVPREPIGGCSAFPAPEQQCSHESYDERTAITSPRGSVDPIIA